MMEKGVFHSMKDLEYIVTHEFEGIKTKVYLVRIFEEPYWIEKDKMNKWILIKNEELRGYYMTPTIEKYE